ncbi:MAG: Ig-like domain-containing protein [Christensenellales bacterium]|jgi:hypothetical protein
MRKRLILFCILLCVLAAFSARAEAGLTVSVGDATAAIDGSATVNISVDQNSGFAGTVFDVLYDADAFSVTDVQAQEDFVASVNPVYAEGRVRAALARGTNIEVQGNLLQITFQAKDAAQAGNYPVTVSFVDGQTVGQDLSALPAAVSKSGSVTILAPNALSISQMPTKTAYIEGQPFDGSGMVVLFRDAQLEQHEVTEYTVSPEVLSLGDTQVTISYEYEQGKTAKAFVPVTVSEKTVIGLEIASPPLKTQYSAFDAFDRAGMVVSAHYDNDTTDEIENFTVETINGSDTLRTGEAYVTVRYQGKTANVTITVSKREPTVRPAVGTDTLYTSSTQLPPIALSEGDTLGHIAWEHVDFPLEAGEEIDAQWTFAPVDAENFLPASGSVRFTVSEVVIAHIRAGYTQGEKRIYTSTPLEDIRRDLLVEAIYNDGSTKDVTSEAELSGILTEGESTLTVTYEGFTAEVTVSVTAVVLESIDVALDTGTDTIYETATYEDIRRYLTVTATYNDGSSKAVTAEATLSGTIAAGNCVLTVEYGDMAKYVMLTIEAVAVTGVEAIFAQGNAVFCPGVDLNALRAHLTVNVRYNSGATESDISEYILSGTLTAPEAAITVQAGGESATFTAQISEHAWGEYEIVHYPDRKKEGEKRRTCPICGGTESLAIPIVRSVSVREKKIALGVGETYQIAPILKPEGAEAQYTYTSRRKTVAEVSGGGLISAVKAGSTTVTVRTATGKTASLSVTVLAAPDSVALQDVPTEMGVGERAAYSLAFTPAKKVRNAATVTSNDENILRVEGGNLVAVSEGEANVTATTYNGRTHSVNVRVCPAIETLSFEGEFTISVGEKKTVSAIRNGDAKGKITYSTKTKGDRKIVSVTADGTLKGRKVGAATVVATAYNGVTAEMPVYVIAAPKRVKLSTTKVTLGANGDVRSGIRATVSPEGVDETLQVTTSDEDIATVAISEDGTYTVTSGEKAGKATIRFTAVNEKTAKCTVTVTKAPTEAGHATLGKAKLTIKAIGKSAKLSVGFARGFGGTVTKWKSSDEAVATVENGKVVAVGAGEAYITAELYNGYETPPCKVTVSIAAKGEAVAPEETADAEEVPEAILPIFPTAFAEGAQIVDCAFASINDEGEIAFEGDWNGNGKMTVSIGDVLVTIAFADGSIESVNANGLCEFAVSGMDDAAGDADVAFVKKGKLRIVGEGKAKLEGFTVTVKFPEKPKNAEAPEDTAVPESAEEEPEASAPEE